MVAERLPGEETRARAIGSRVTLLTTMPRMVSGLSDVDQAPLRLATARNKRRKIAQRTACRGTRSGKHGGTGRDKWGSPLFKTGLLQTRIIVAKIREMHNSQRK